MEANRDCSKLALLHDSGVIQVVSGDLRTKLHSMDFKHSVVGIGERKWMWCGDHALGERSTYIMTI